MNKTILLTGATGFLGSHLLDALIENQYKVVILKRSFSDTWRIRHVLSKVVCYDIDLQPMDQAFKDQVINVVIHTATHYGRNTDPASKIIETNTLFPLQLLEIATSFKIDKFINTDTFLNRHFNIYTLSKKHFKDWLKLFCNNGRTKGINLKVDHMYGPKDDKKKFVFWLSQQLLNNVNSIPLTKGEQKRDFVYVSDVVSVYLMLLKNDPHEQFTEFELGTGKSIALKDFIFQVKSAIEAIKGHNLLTKLDFGALPYRQGEVMEIKADISRLKSMGWEPRYTLNNGLKEMLLKDIG